MSSKNYEETFFGFPNRLVISEFHILREVGYSGKGIMQGLSTLHLPPQAQALWRGH